MALIEHRSCIEARTHIVRRGSGFPSTLPVSLGIDLGGQLAAALLGIVGLTAVQFNPFS